MRGDRRATPDAVFCVIIPRLILLYLANISKEIL